MSDDYVINDSAVSPAGNRLLSMFKRTDEQPRQEMLFRVVTPSSSPMSLKASSPFGEISALEAHIAQLRSSITRETETKRQYESQLDEIQSVAGNLDSTIRSISRNSMLSNSTWSSNHTGFSTLASGSSISSIDEEMLRKMDNEEYYASVGNEVTVAMERLRDEFEERWSALAKNCELLGNEVDGLAEQLKEVSKLVISTIELL
jgi:chaperonin cofactor prefoldin